MRHLREEARFTLQLLNQPPEALKLAQDNWAVSLASLDIVQLPSRWVESAIATSIAHNELIFRWA